jgi:membrane fusion protein (multidrug efflux system)
MPTFNRSLLVSFFITTCILSVACKGKKDPPKQNQQAAPVVDVIVAESKTLSNVIEANGNVISNEFVELHPEVSGRITYLNVPEGKFISQGTLIARINDQDLQAQLQKSKVQLDLAKQTQERLQKLLDIGGVNQADYDAAVNNVNSLTADMQYTQALIDKTFIKAPFSGVVGLRQVSLGAFVSNANVIATMQQLDKLKVDFTVPESYSNYIKVGSILNMKLDEADSNMHKATILAVEPQANTSTRNLKARAIFQDNTKANPGAFVKVYLNATVDKKAILIPTNCIIPSDKNKQVVIVKDGNATFIDIETGVRQENSVEVIKGINAGDSVVVTGVLFARDKKPVKVRGIKKLEDFNTQ